MNGQMLRVEFDETAWVGDAVVYAVETRGDLVEMNMGEGLVVRVPALWVKRISPADAGSLPERPAWTVEDLHQLLRWATAGRTAAELATVFQTDIPEILGGFHLAELGSCARRPSRT